MKKSIFLTVCSVSLALGISSACQTASSTNIAVNANAPQNNANAIAVASPPVIADPNAAGSSPEKPIEINRPDVSYDGSTPTAAYKSLFKAVKSGNVETIRGHLSVASLAFAEYIAGMQKKTPEEVAKNGFFEANLSPKLPALRDERIEGNFAAVEARLPSGKWEMIPFVKEDGKWRLAVGEMFGGSFKMSSRAKSQIEAENANSKGGGLIPMTTVNTNVNANNPNPIAAPDTAPSVEGKNRKGAKPLGVPQS